mmetsp:Transcript_7252/g.22452  ORF Transcript_7252/g.22452 Transcript_7252/m.22452 type:complete len:100 (+) Transcript_7252:119-418(+)
MAQDHAPTSPPDSPGGSPASRSLRREASRHSIISGKSGRQSRVDAHGNTIEKGKKMHHCAFPDDKDSAQPVSQTFEVTAYKGTFPNMSDGGSQGCCTVS